MSISAPYGAKGVGSILTSGDANALSTAVQSVLDKRSGQTDTLQSVVTATGSGAVISSYAAGADADTTYLVSSGIGILNASTGLTAARAYTFSNTGATVGRQVLVFGGAFDVTLKNAAGTTLIVVGTANSGVNQSRWAQLVHNGSVWVLQSSSFGPIQQRQTFSANGTYTVPADCYKLMVIGCGGGGGGSGGSGNAAGVTTYFASGGGGGGAAQTGCAWVDVTPGQSITVTVGTGGGGGLGGNAAAGGAAGGDGSATTFGSAVTFAGAQGGNATAPSTASGNPQYTFGGGPIAGMVKRSNVTLTAADNTVIVLPGYGGYGVSSAATPVNAPNGAIAPMQALLAGTGTTSPGAGGATGATSGAYGGGGGGGGAASTFGSGGAGGAGGAGSSAATTTTGVAGVAGTQGSGGGGGSGGGSSTNGAAGALNGGAGGAGGNGVLVVIPIR